MTGLICILVSGMCIGMSQKNYLSMMPKYNGGKK